MTHSDLNQRLTALERQVNQLARKVEANGDDHPNAWIDEIRGTFPNDSTYRLGARLGREWRKAQRPRKAKARKASRG